MTDVQLAQAIGLGGLTTFAFITWRIALLNGKRYARYGREALACVSAFFTLAIITIALSLAGLLSAEDSRTINLLSSIVPVLILFQLGAATAIEMNMEKRNGERKE